jgi:hypothetical protein
MRRPPLLACCCAVLSIRGCSHRQSWERSAQPWQGRLCSLHLACLAHGEFAAKSQKFEVGRHTESTATKKKGVLRGEELAWDEELQIDTDNSADAELHVRPWDFERVSICCLCAIC